MLSFTMRYDMVIPYALEIRYKKRLDQKASHHVSITFWLKPKKAKYTNMSNVYKFSLIYTIKCNWENLDVDIYESYLR